MRMMLGGALAAGLLLIVSPWLWSRSRTRRPPRLRRALRVRLAQAGLAGLPVRGLAAVSLLAAIAAWGAALAVTGVAAFAAIAGVLALVAPAMVVITRAAAARRAARTAWPDLLDHLIASVRSGIPLAEALSGLAVPSPPAFREAFTAFGAAYRSTGNFGLCIDQLEDRLADPVADRLLETLRMAREVGGAELPGVLRALAASLRADAAVRSEIEARQSWVRGAAKLGVAAPWIVLVLLSTRAEAAAAYASPAGIALLIGGLAVSVVAYRLMLAAGRLPEERRWFR